MYSLSVLNSTSNIFIKKVHISRENRHSYDFIYHLFGCNEFCKKSAVELEIERMNRVLDMLKFKCWYYEEAIKDGNEKQLMDMKPEDMPKKIRQAYETSHT